PVAINMTSAAFNGVGGAFGKVILGSNNALGVNTGTAGTGVLTLTSGALESSSATGVTLANPTVNFSNSNVQFTGTSPLTFTGAVPLANSNTLIIPNALQTTTFTGVVSGSGTLTLAGQGTLSLTGANSNTGAVTISGGTVVLSGPSGSLAGLSAASSLTINT